MIPFDAASDIPIEDQKIQAMKKIQVENKTYHFNSLTIVVTNVFYLKELSSLVYVTLFLKRGKCIIDRTLPGLPSSEKSFCLPSKN